MEIKVGDRVRLTNARPPLWNKRGKMDHYLGTIQTVTRLNSHWFWFDGCGSWSFQLSDIVEVLPKFQRGDRVLMRDNDGEAWEPVIFLCEIEGAEYPFICVSQGYEQEFRDGEEFSIHYFRFCKPIEKVEITLDEIDEKFNVNKDQIVIK